jgi:hypothetical protein
MPPLFIDHDGSQQDTAELFFPKGFSHFLLFCAWTKALNYGIKDIENIMVAIVPRI